MMKLKVEYENEREARIIDEESGLIVAKVYVCTDGLLVNIE